jgi:putative lipoic acid-binding regulatory protein
MTQTTLMEFPCTFPVKIIGITSSSFLNEIKKIILKHFPDFSDADLTSKISQKNNYLAITVKVLAQNQAMLDAFYQEITRHPDIKMVL